MQRHPDDSPRDQGRQKAHQEEAAGDCKLGLLPGPLSASALLTAVAACVHHSLAAPPSSVMLPLYKQNSLLDFSVTLAKLCKVVAVKLTYWGSERISRSLVGADALADFFFNENKQWLAAWYTDAGCMLYTVYAHDTVSAVSVHRSSKPAFLSQGGLRYALA